MKRLLVLVLTVLVVATLFGGGQGEQEATATEGIEVSPPGEYPVATAPLTLEVMIVDPGTDYEDNDFTRWIEDKTGVSADFSPVPRKDSAQKLNIVLASGDLPDVFLGWRLQPAQLAEYGSQGILRPLNTYLDELGFHTKQWMEQYPSIRPQITNLDGKIYTIPMFNQCYHCSMGNKLWINEDWLSSLGLDMPRTTEDFYETLKAFKEQDPNGNGIADEIPLSAAQAQDENLNGTNSLIPHMMNPWVYIPSGFNNLTGMLTLDNGRVMAAYAQEGWREGLRFMKRLYEDDLLDPESFVMDNQQLEQLAESEVQVLGAAPGLTMPAQYLGDSGHYRDYVVVPALEGPAGQRYTSWNPYAGVQPGVFMLTSAAEHPEVAFRWADTFWDVTYETTLRCWFGQEGEGWRWAEEGEIGINGEPAIWRQIPRPPSEEVTLNDYGWTWIAATFRDAVYRLGRVRSDDPHDLELVLYGETKEKQEPYQPPRDIILPPVQFTPEEAEMVTDIETTINRFVTQATAEFVVGGREIEGDWETYVRDLNRMGLEELLSMYQKAYDRYLAINE